jgi:HEAT repeat protein/beta-lactamase regulating signal transducer with metallopeptidase domain
MNMLSWNLPLEWLALADAVAKATLILVAASCISFALRRGSAAARHLVWTLALCSAVVLPALSLALPRWELPIVRTGSVQAPPAAAREEPGAPAPVANRLENGPRLPRAASAARDKAPRNDVSPVSSAIPLRLTWPQALFTIWLAGALAILARLAIGVVAVRWLSRRTQEVTDARWLPMARALAHQVGVRGRLRFLRSGRASMPVAAGIFRPSLIMPADADSWSDDRLRVVLLHELAHVKRRDCLTHLIAQVACAFYWFNPLAWIAAKRARTERERACDDLVLAAGTRGSDYADQLLDIARCMRGDRLAGLLSGASLAMAHQSQLEGRLIAILDPRVPRAGVSRARAFAAVALCSCAVAPLGALQPWMPATGTGGSPVATTATDLALPTLSRQGGGSDTDVPQSNTGTTSERRDTGTLPGAPVRTPQQSIGLAPDPEPRRSFAGGPRALPDVSELTGAIAQAAADAGSDGVESAVDGAIENAVQEAKPEPRPRSGSQADPRMVAALTAALKDSDKDVRETAMHALVQLRDPAIFEPLLQALKDPAPDVREHAAFGLGQMRDRRAVAPLTEALKDASASVREKAAFALGQLHDRSAVPGLIAALKDTSADVREQAAFALGQLKDPAAVDALGAALQDASPSVREQAIFALGQLRDRRSVQPLISALKDSSAEVREQAAFALGQLRDRTAVDALMVAVKDASASVREQVVFALGQLRDPRAIDALTTALKDANAGVRQQAAFALGQLAR